MKIQPVTTKIVNYNAQNIDKKYNDFENSVTSDILFTHAVKTGTRFNILEFFKRIFCIKPKMVEMPKPKPEPILTEVQKVAKRIKENYGIECDFAECMNVALCTEAVARIMKDIFGQQALPSRVEYDYLSKYIENDLGVLGIYSPATESVIFNRKYDRIYSSKEGLMLSANAQKGKLLLPDEASIIHPLHPFVHEFSHSAHYANLKSKNNTDTWIFLINNYIPSSVGRLIAKYKLGKYSVEGDLREFMAERMSQDICQEINPIYLMRHMIHSDIDYSNIFEKKWNCRFVCPQAYLDYYTQQVWNGDMMGMQKAVDEIEFYLKELERQEAIQKQHSLIGIMDFSIAKIKEWGGSVTNGISNFLDRINSIKVTINNKDKIHF